MKMRSSRPKIKVFVVEDEPRMRDGYRLDLTQDARTLFIDSAESIDTAKTKLAQLLNGEEVAKSNSATRFPDVVLLDMQFPNARYQPELRGLELVEKVTELRDKFAGLNMKILCVSSNIQPDLVEEAIRRGARGYLYKGDLDDGWIEAVDMVHRGFYVISRGVRDNLTFAAKLTEIDDVYTLPEHQIPLSDRAKDVAFHCIKCRLTAAEAAERLGMSEHGVRWYLRVIKKSGYFQRFSGNDNSNAGPQD